MTLTPAQIEALVRANADALGLRLTPEQMPGVLRYVTLAADMAALVEALPLGRDDEAATVFVPVVPAARE
jgi:hypothetical protein